MRVRKLTDNQLRELYCAAMGWHVDILTDKGPQHFDRLYDSIEILPPDSDPHASKDCKTMRARPFGVDTFSVQIEILQLDESDDIYFRCGNLKYYGKGGQGFNLSGAVKCLKNLGFTI